MDGQQDIIVNHKIVFDTESDSIEQFRTGWKIGRARCLAGSLTDKIHEEC